MNDIKDFPIPTDEEGNFCFKSRMADSNGQDVLPRVAERKAHQGSVPLKVGANSYACQYSYDGNEDGFIEVSGNTNSLISIATPIENCPHCKDLLREAK